MRKFQGSTKNPGFTPVAAIPRDFFHQSLIQAACTGCLLPNSPMRVRAGCEPANRWYKLRLPRVALLGCLMAGTAYPALAQTAWTGAAGNDDWFDAGNWDTSAVPGASTSIEVNSGHAVISGNAAEGDNVSIVSGGTVIVTGTGSTLTTTETRTDGGSFTIEDGGLVTNSSGVVGGIATVSGTDAGGNASTWINNDYFAVGDGGTGTLNILGGGKVVVNTDAILGQSFHGSALVSGPGSSWENTGRLTIDNGSLRIEDGGSVSNTLGIVGDSDTGDAVVTGPGSSWVNTGQLTVGSFATGTMRVENGAAVISNQGYVGASVGSDGSVTVTGNGSSWQVTDFNLTLGHFGVGSMIIDDGGRVFAKTGVWLGVSATDAIGTLNINGTPGARGVLETSGFRGGMGTADLTLDGGIVRAIDDNAAFFSNYGTQQVQLGAGGGIIDTDGHDIGIAPVISGVGRLTKDGLGTLTLTGENIYGGGTTIIDGTLQLGDGGTTGSILGDVTDDGILAFNRSDVVTFGGTITGTGGVHQIGSGRTILTADSSGLVGVSQVQNGILSVNGILGGAMEVRGGRLQGIGQVGGTTNFTGGVIAPGNSIGTLTVSGNYIGNGGTLEIETVLGDDSSAADKLVVTGNTSGNTNVHVINLGGLGAQTVEGIKIVDVGGISNGNFTLLGSYTFEGDPAVVAGAYAYRLYQGGVSTPTDGDWYLRSALLNSVSPLYQPGAPVYEAYAGVLQSFNELDTLQQRLGNRSWPSSAIAANTPPNNADGAGSGVWGRIFGRHTSIDPVNATTGANYDADIWQLQVGVDGQLYSIDAGDLTGGISARYGTISADVSSSFGNGSINSSGYGVGGSMTWYGKTGFYLDAQANATWYDSDLSSSTAGMGLVSSNNGFGYAFGLEAGQQIALGASWSVTPQAQLTYSAVDYDDFTDVFGSTVSQTEAHNLRGRLGISADYEAGWIDDTGQTNRLHAYGIANLYYNFQSDTEVTLSGVRLASEQDPLWGGLGLGGTYNWGDNKYAVYGEATVDTSLNDVGDSYALTGRMGLNVKF